MGRPCSIHMREDKCIEKFCRVGGAEREGAVYAALHTLSFVQYGCFAGKCILTGSKK